VAWYGYNNGGHRAEKKGVKAAAAASEKWISSGVSSRRGSAFSTIMLSQNAVA